MATLGLMAAGSRPATEIAEHSRTALDRSLLCEAELSVALVTDEARILGAFQRLEEPSNRAGSASEGSRRCLRRGSGGPEVLVGPGTLHVALALANPGILAACDETRIVNRYVRPLLRALAATGSPAAFFGRDWISVSKQPVAWVGFGHDATTGRTLFEAFVAVASPFASPGRGSFRGKVPSTLQSIAGRVLDPARLAHAVVDAYAEGRDVRQLEPTPVTAPDFVTATEVTSDPPWAATYEEVIGIVGAGPDSRGVFRVGGDLLVSRDALARLETRAAQASEEDIGPIVDATLKAPGVALDGVRTLASLRDVIARARRNLP